MALISLQEITGMFANCGYTYDVIMVHYYSLVDFIEEVSYDSRFYEGDIFYIIRGEKTKIAHYQDRQWGPLTNISVVANYRIKKVKASKHDGALDFYCFIEPADNKVDNDSVNAMDVFSEEPKDDTLSKPEWQLDRKALDFIHDAEATGSYLKQIDMIDTVDSLEFSKAIMKRLFQKLNRLRGHK